MSCYCKMKVLRIPYEPKAWGWGDIAFGDDSWYNATEAPDYYDIESDPFYDPV